MPKPLRLPDDDRPRRKKKPAGDGPPVGPLIGAGVGGVVLLALVGVVWWAVTRDGPPRPRAAAPTPASPSAKTPATQPKQPPPTADEYYQWLVGGVWSRTAEDPLLGGKKTTTLTFLADKTLVVKQTVPDLLGGITGEAPGKDRELATTMSVTVEAKGDRLLLVRSSDAELLGAGFKRFRVRLNPDNTITLTEQGDESKFQPTPYTRPE